MIGSSDNSGGVVVGALVCGIVADSNLALCFDFFSLVDTMIFLSSRMISRAIPARIQYSTLQ